MRLNVTALGLAMGLIWGAAILLAAAANQIWPDYGRGFLDLMASVYPGYRPASGAGSIVVGALYGLVDGAVAGGLLAWIYNRLVHDRRGTA